MDGEKEKEREEGRAKELSWRERKRERERERERERKGYVEGETNCTNMAMLSSSRMLSNAPTSSHVMSGTVANPSRFAEGCTNPRASYEMGRDLEWPSPTSKQVTNPNTSCTYVH